MSEGHLSRSLYIGSISASTTACPLRGYGRAVGDAEMPPVEVALLGREPGVLLLLLGHALLEQRALARARLRLALGPLEPILTY